jgi:monoterpene epsilon-lactone hydrolase
MSENAAAGVALPSYARRIAHPGGSVRRWWLHAMLRLTVKRMKVLDADIAVLRAHQAGMDARFARVDPAARRTAVDCGGIPAEWIEVPETRPERVLLYLHGGAFMFRFPQTHAGMVAKWCRPLAARTLMVDYRLAPENPYPAAIEDCHGAYRWLLAQGHAAASIVIGGDSAGGNLALATLHRIKAAGEPMPACAVLQSPVVDFTMSGRSIIANEHSDPMFRIAGLLAMRALYAPPERFLDPSVSPLFGDFAGFPPLLFQVGGIESLVDESTRAAARAHAAGVAVELEIWDDMPHVFQAFAALPQAAAGADSFVRFIRARAGWTA